MSQTDTRDWAQRAEEALAAAKKNTEQAQETAKAVAFRIRKYYKAATNKTKDTLIRKIEQEMSAIRDIARANEHNANVALLAARKDETGEALELAATTLEQAKITRHIVDNLNDNLLCMITTTAKTEKAQ